MEKQLEYFQSRKARAELFITLGGLSLILAFALFFTILYDMPTLFVILLFIAITLLIIGGTMYSKVSHDFKHDFLVKLMGDLIDDGRYSPKHGLASQQIYQTEFLKRADRIKTEDLLQGTIDGVAFVSSDVRLEERRVRHTKHGTQTYYEKFFMGRVFIFEFNKNFDGYLQVLEQGRPTVNRRYEKVKLESIEFNKKFKTYATNPHTAFFILTPHLMENMMKFEKNNPGRLNFSFIDTRMYVAINNNKDTFSLAIYRKIDASLIESFKRDVQVIYDLIDDLKLNVDIYKKEV